MAYFPFFINLTGKSGLIVGGGKVAERKIEKLLEFGPKLTVLAPSIKSEITNNKKLKIIKREYKPGDEEQFTFVIGATNNQEVNNLISKRCKERKIPVNVVDNPELCSFIFPSIIKEGKLVVGISTSGASPTAGIEIKKRIQEVIPDNFDAILDYLNKERDNIKKMVKNEDERYRILQKLFIEAMENNV